MTTVPRGRTRARARVQTGGAAAGFHHDVVVSGGEIGGQESGDPPGPGQGQVLGVVPRQVDVGAAQGQDPGNLQSQGTVAHHQDPGRGGHRRGFEDPEGRGQGFGEDRKDVGDFRGHGVEVGRGQGEVGGKGAVVVLEPQDPALPAVPGQAPAAEVAGPATAGDFPHHPLAQPGGSLGAGHLAHELVAHDALKAVVALEDLQVGAADAGQMDPDENLAVAGCGPGHFLELGLSVKRESKHKSCQQSAVSFQPRPRLAKVIIRLPGSVPKV